MCEPRHCSLITFVKCNCRRRSNRRWKNYAVQKFSNLCSAGIHLRCGDAFPELRGNLGKMVRSKSGFARFSNLTFALFWNEIRFRGVENFALRSQDISAFSEDDFDAKLWINRIFKSGEARENKDVSRPGGQWRAIAVRFRSHEPWSALEPAFDSEGALEFGGKKGFWREMGERVFSNLGFPLFFLRGYGLLWFQQFLEFVLHFLIFNKFVHNIQFISI